MPEAAVAAAGVLILVGGFCVPTGFQPYVGLSCVAVFLVCVTPMMHNFASSATRRCWAEP